MEMNVEKQSIKFIKPLVPTPQTHRHYKLGLIDEAAPFIGVTIALFFANNNHIPKFVAQLEKSLEKILTRLYPLAGRYVEESQSIECNDDGVEFIHAKVNIKLQEILNSDVSARMVEEFIPSKGWAALQFTDPILSVQVTKFECGGVALGVNATHKIVDASTLCTFLNAWAAVNREENEIEFIGIGFNSSSLLPARGLCSNPLPLITDDMLSNYTRKKFSFSESEITKLKSSTHRWSKVQLVEAIIWKAFISVDHAIHKYSRESVVIQPINLRVRMASLISKNSCGGFSTFCTTKSGTLKNTTSELADLISDSIKEDINKYSKVHHDTEEGQLMIVDLLSQANNIPESTNVINLTSWCNFPFYEANFGFGKPIWMAPGNARVAINYAFVMDDAGGNGVDAHVFLEVKDVQSFEEALDVNALGS